MTDGGPVDNHVSVQISLSKKKTHSHTHILTATSTALPKASHDGTENMLALKKKITHKQGEKPLLRELIIRDKNNRAGVPTADPMLS